jgi:multiple sugar transport system substrate-binding protein
MIRARTGTFVARPSRARWLRHGILAAILVFSGLSSTRGPVVAASSVTLQFLGTGGMPAYKSVFAAFERAHPGVTIQYNDVPFNDYQNTIVQRFTAGGSGIDVFMVDPTYIPTWTQRGFLLDLTSAFAAKMRGVMNPNDIAGATYLGHVRTMPIWDSTQLLYYNIDLLKKAGIQPPGSGIAARWTWEKLATTAKQAMTGGAKYGFDFEQVDRYYQLQPLPESLGGGPGVTGQHLLTVDITNPAWEKAAAWYGSIFKDGIAPRGLLNNTQTTAAFEAGQLAFFVGGPWWLPAFNAAKGLHYGYAPQPYFAGGKVVTPSESWHWGIYANSSHADLALQLLAFGGLDTNGNLLTTDTLSLPAANVKAAAIELPRLAASNPHLKGVDRLIEYELKNTAVRRPRSLGYLQLEDLVSRAFGDIRDGLNPATVLKQTQAQLVDAFSRIQPPAS